MVVANAYNRLTQTPSRAATELRASVWTARSLLPLWGTRHTSIAAASCARSKRFALFAALPPRHLPCQEPLFSLVVSRGISQRSVSLFRFWCRNGFGGKATQRRPRPSTPQLSTLNPQPSTAAVQEGLLREFARKGDTLHDVVMMALLRKEWPPAQKLDRPAAYLATQRALSGCSTGTTGRGTVKNSTRQDSSRNGNISLASRQFL